MKRDIFQQTKDFLELRLAILYSVVVNAPNKEQARSPDIYAELLKLDDLRKKGIINEAEFEAQKRRLLELR